MKKHEQKAANAGSSKTAVSEKKEAVKKVVEIGKGSSSKKTESVKKGSLYSETDLQKLKQRNLMKRKEHTKTKTVSALQEGEMVDSIVDGLEDEE